MKKVLVIIFLIFTILLNFLVTTYAAVNVTEETLKDSFNSLMEEISNGTTDSEIANNITAMNIDKENKQIKFTSEDTEYFIAYDLSNKPTFLFETTIDNTTTYDEWEEKQEQLSIVRIPYALIANLNGISVQDSMTYLAMEFLSFALNSGTNSSKYTVIELGEGVTMPEKDENTILSTEFPEYAVRYVKDLYSSNTIYSDSDDCNTFEYAIKVKESSENSCTLQSCLTVNLDGNFSAIDEHVDSIFNDNVDITEENADYVIKLSVGEKYKFQTNEKIDGHALFMNTEYVEFSDDNSEIIALNVGTTYGYIYMGEKEMSFYVTVTEKDTTISSNKDNNSNQTDEDNKDTNSVQTNNDIVQNFIDTQTKLPQTGDFFNVQDALLVLILICIVGLITLIIPNAKYKNMNKK